MKRLKKNYELVLKNCTELEKSNINLIHYDFDKPFCLAQIARCYFMEKDIENAITYFKNSIDLRPMANTIWDLVNIYYSKLNNFNNVLKYSKIYMETPHIQIKDEYYENIIKTLKHIARTFNNKEIQEYLTQKGIEY